MARGTQNAAYPRESWSDTESVCAVRPVSFAYYMLETSKGISLDNLVRKQKQCITPLPHPPLSFESVSPCYNLTTGGNV